MSERSEHELLVAKATEGDHASLQKLMLFHSAELTNYISAKIPSSMRSVVDVEDILQQTFMQVFRDIHRYEIKADRSFLSWLMTIAEHRAMDAARGLKRVKRGGQFVDVGHLETDESRSISNLVDMLSAGSHTPSRSAAGHEAVAAVQRAIEGLADDYQQAVRLHLLQGKTLQETATAMNRSPRAVKGLVDRAKKKMRAALGRLSLYK